VRLPGFEPGLQAWEAYVITTGPQPLYVLDFHIEYLKVIGSIAVPGGKNLKIKIELIPLFAAPSAHARESAGGQRLREGRRAFGNPRLYFAPRCMWGNGRL
jgi:hypothetical protein